MKYLIIIAALAALCSSASVPQQFLVKPRAEDSCVGRCGINDPAYSCQCNTECVSFSDCCADYDTVCFTCQDRCGESYNYANPCVCSGGCEDFGDCCTDYSEICSGGSTGGSCASRCGENDPAFSCQCNSQCESFDDCCSDYSDLCSGGGGSLTDQDILDFTEQIFTIGQPDFVGNYIVFDSQPPGPLFLSIDEDQAFASDTMQTFLTLRTFYEPDSCISEDLTAAYETAKSAFLDAVMATEVMTTTEAFVHDNALLSESETLRDFIDTAFFHMYTRCGSAEGSSGFEHSFCGEIDDNQVKGFHNWISFYLDELVGQIDYDTYIDEQNISPELDLFMMGFQWLGDDKPITSMWIGSTPEMELSLYAVSFLYKSNSLVSVSMNGAGYRIQTYTQAYNGETLVGSAYPDIS